MAVDYFQPDTLQQSNPILSGFQSGQSLQGQLALLRAQAGLANAQTQYFPMTAAGQYYGGLGRYLQGTYNFSPFHNVAALQNNPAFQAMMANNPALRRDVANIMANGVMGGGMGMPGMPPQIPGMGTPQAGAQQPNAQSSMPSPAGGDIPLTPQQQQTLNAVKQGIQSGQQQGASSLNNAPFIPSQNAQSQNGILNQSDYDVFGDTAGSRAIDVTVPKQIQLQRTYSQSFDKQMEPWIPKLPDISNFAGAAGKANLTADKYASAFNLNNSPQYQNWNAFTNAASELAGNELRRALGVNSSIAQREDMEHLMDPAYWNEHPADALARFNALMAAKKANDQVLAQSQYQTLGSLKQQAAAPTFQYATQPGQSAALGNGQYQLVTRKGGVRTVSDADLAYTAQQNNMTVQQVKQKLGIR